MANTVIQTAASGVALKDARLLREACYVDGAWLTSVTGATTNVDNPATGEILGTVPRLGVAETRAAIVAANQAFPGWSKKTGKERAAVLRRWPNRTEKLPTPRPSSNGLAKKPSASMATRFPDIKLTSAS